MRWIYSIRMSVRRLPNADGQKELSCDRKRAIGPKQRLLSSELLKRPKVWKVCIPPGEEGGRVRNELKQGDWCKNPHQKLQAD